MDHEIELCVLINKAGKHIAKEDAMKHIGGYFLGLDMSDRTFQKDFRPNGFPWELVKCQDFFCPVTSLIKEQIDPYNVELHMQVNNETKQKEKTSEMHFKIDDVISFTSKYIKLDEGDLIMTGTPAGVGPVKLGDNVQATASVEGKVVAELKCEVTK